MPTKREINMMLEETLLTEEKFNNIIEFNRNKFDSYLETIVDYCVTHNMEVVQIKKILNPQIMSKLTSECERSNLIIRTSKTVPLFD